MKLLKFSLFFALGLLILGFALPSLVSTDWGKQKLLSIINERIPGEIQAKELSLSWFAKQQLSGVSLRDEQDRLVASLETMRTDASLFSILWNGAFGSPIALDHFDLYLVTDRQGKTNFERAVNPLCCALESDSSLTVALKNMKGELHLGNQESILIHLAGETQKGTVLGSFALHAELQGISFKQLFQNEDFAGQLASKSDAAFKINADMNHFPVELLDQIMAYKKPEFAGLLPQLLGPELNLHIVQNRRFQDIAISMKAESARVNVTLDGVIAADKKIALKAKATASQVPVRLIQALDDRTSLLPFLGTALDIELQTELNQMNGPVFLTLKGEEGSLLLDGQLNNRWLTLRNDLVIQVDLTPQLSQYLMQKSISMTDGIVKADYPLKLTIGPKNFQMPIDHPSLSNTSIGKAVLELGILRFSNSTRMAKLLNALTFKSDRLTVWTTPIYFSLNKGNASLQRFDLLVNERYPLASWGSVDFANERLEMVVGLSGKSISKAFGIADLSTPEMVQLPLKGSFKDPSIDRKKAAARLSALLAQNQGGPQGVVLGTILNIASGGLTEPPPPEPTTNPLPWAEMLSQEKEISSADRNLPEQAVDELRKGAKSLLKQLFR